MKKSIIAKLRALSTKTFLVVYTRNDLQSVFGNETVNATGSAAARDQIIEKLGDTIVILNIIELD